MVDETLVKSIVQQVLQEMSGYAQQEFDKSVDPSGVIRITPSSVCCEPFNGNNHVKLKDIVTLQEAPRMGAGIMELDHTSFEWTLQYDEYDMVIDGVLEIKIDGRVTIGYPGDIIYIPKGSHIFFQTPATARFAYFVYPANWQQQV